MVWKPKTSVLAMCEPGFRQLADEHGKIYVPIRSSRRLEELFQEDKFDEIVERALELVAKMPDKGEMVF